MTSSVSEYVYVHARSRTVITLSLSNEYKEHFKQLEILFSYSVSTSPVCLFVLLLCMRTYRVGFSEALAYRRYSLNQSALKFVLQLIFYGVVLALIHGKRFEL